MRLKRIFAAITLCLIVSAFLLAKSKVNKIEQVREKSEWHEGDLIFQTSVSPLNEAIQLATKSKFSHCGIIYKKEGKYYVLEAVQPVKLTPLATWIESGKDGKYVVKRLKNATKILTQSNVSKMEEIGERFIGKDYDLAFNWSDDKMYCSELIWKVYKRALGIEIGKLQKLSELDLSSEPVKKKLNELYGNKIPLQETVISPSAIFASELLVTVKAN